MTRKLRTINPQGNDEQWEDLHLCTRRNVTRLLHKSILLFLGAMFVLSLNCIAQAADDQSDAEQQQTVDQAKDESLNDYILEDTVVTASKRDVNVQSIPMSIQALTGEHLEAIGAVGFEDFIDRIPGLTISQTGSGENSLQIRGISSFAPTATGSATVGYYIDDTPISSAILAPDISLFDLERIEVLKGPQGTLYGEGSLGGTIRLITRKPQLNEFENKTQLIVSKTKNSPGYNYQINNVINVPLIDDKLAFRLSGSYSDDDGFVDDANSGDEGTNFDQTGSIHAALRFESNERLTITPSLSYQKTDGGGPSYDSDLYPDLTYFRESPEESVDDEYTILGLTVEYDFGWAELTSNTSFYDREHKNVRDVPDQNDLMNYMGFLQGDDVNSPFLQMQADTEENTFSQELRLVSSGDDPWSWLVGGFYRHRKIEDYIFSNNDQLAAFNGTGNFLISDNDQTAEHIAVFGEVNYDILDNLILTGGIRWFREEIEADNFFGSIFMDFADMLQFFSGTTQTNLTEEGQLFKLALSYNPTEYMMLYAQFSQGVRPGGINEGAIDFGFGTDIVSTFDSDSTDNYEVGIKSDWFNGRLRANANCYYIVWKDIQLMDMDSMGQIFVENAGKASSTGFEIELIGQPVTGLTLGLNMGYNVAETTETTVNNMGTIQDGTTLPFAPELSGSIFVDYAFPVSDSLTGFVGADLQYVDEQVPDIQIVENDPVPILEAYHTVNLTAGVMSGSWSAHIFVNNVTDERAELQQVFWPAQGTLRNQPRTIGLQFTKSF